MSEIILAMLSGLIGAIGGSIATIGFTVWKDNKTKKLTLAKEKLNKVYGPLVALKKKIDVVHNSKGGFLIPSTDAEVKMVEEIIFNYYYLIDNNLKEDLPMLLDPHLKSNTARLMKFPEMMDKIYAHYNQNKKILGLK